MPDTSFSKDKMKFVLLEGVHASAVNAFRADGYSNIDLHQKALPEPQLVEAARDAYIVGIRSATQLTRGVLAAAPHLIAIGCFCIGTNQVDLETAQYRGIPVFNAPFSNTRSVAELVLAEIVSADARHPRDATPPPIAANGLRPPQVPARRAAKPWASSATATSARKSACWPKPWVCMWCFTTSK